MECLWMVMIFFTDVYRPAYYSYLVRSYLASKRVMSIVLPETFVRVLANVLCRPVLDVWLALALSLLVLKLSLLVVFCFLRWWNCIHLYTFRFYPVIVDCVMKHVKAYTASNQSLKLDWAAEGCISWYECNAAAGRAIIVTSCSFTDQ